MELTMEEQKTVDEEIKTAVEKACKKTGITDPKVKAKLETATRNIFVNDTPIYKALGITDELMEQGYALGYHFYQSGNFKNAVVIFRCLLRSDGLNARYFYSIAACHQQLKEYEAAAIYYQAAAYLDPENPIPCYHLYDCCVHLNDLYSAAFALDMVVLRSEKIPKYQQLNTMAKANLESLVETIKHPKKTKKQPN
jgi:type III secretion system low calcium response chaperone LcrH/SycD